MESLLAVLHQASLFFISVKERFHMLIDTVRRLLFLFGGPLLLMMGGLALKEGLRMGPYYESFPDSEGAQLALFVGAGCAAVAYAIITFYGWGISCKRGPLNLIMRLGSLWLFVQVGVAIQPLYPTHHYNELVSVIHGLICALFGLFVFLQTCERQ